LDEFDQNPLPTDREIRVRCRMNKADVVATRAFSDSSRGKPYALGFEPRDGGGEIVDPQPHVMQGRGVCMRFGVQVDRLHQVDFDRGFAFAELRDDFIDVFSFAVKGAHDGEAKQGDPKMLQGASVGGTDGNLLKPKNPKGSLHSGGKYQKETTGG